MLASPNLGIDKPRCLQEIRRANDSVAQQRRLTLAGNQYRSRANCLRQPNVTIPIADHDHGFRREIQLRGCSQQQAGLWFPTSAPLTWRVRAIIYRREFDS